MGQKHKNKFPFTSYSSIEWIKIRIILFLSVFCIFPRIKKILIFWNGENKYNMPQEPQLKDSAKESIVREFLNKYFPVSKL